MSLKKVFFGLFMVIFFSIGFFSFFFRKPIKSATKVSRILKSATSSSAPQTKATSYYYSHGNSRGIRLTGAHDLVITGENIIGRSVPCIELYDCYNIKIIHNKLSGSSQTGISLYNCYNISIQNNQFINVSTGVYAENVRQGRIVVNNNQFLNMQGPYPRGQCVQFNNVNGPGNEIGHNKCENIAGKSHPEDVISRYKCNGTASSPIIVKNNRIRGGGPSKSGGGIMLGDNGGSYQIALNNILVDPGQYGIAISGGDRNTVIGNYIYGRPQWFTNVGLYVAGYGGAKCTNSTVRLNRVNYFNSSHRANGSWIGPNASKPAGWETNTWDAHIGPGIFKKIILN